MALHSDAAMIMFYDVASGAEDDHDDWHTHEHMPERVSIPGFLRGSRWTGADGNWDGGSASAVGERQSAIGKISFTPSPPHSWP
jgi:hypothetical protein